VALFSNILILVFCQLLNVSSSPMAIVRSRLLARCSGTRCRTTYENSAQTLSNDIWRCCYFCCASAFSTL